jgi:hypothetical protein
VVGTLRFASPYDICARRKKAPETSPGLSSFDRPRNYVVVRILKIEAVSFDRGAPSDATTKVTQNHV